MFLGFAVVFSVLQLHFLFFDRFLAFEPGISRVLRSFFVGFPRASASAALALQSATDALLPMTGANTSAAWACPVLDIFVGLLFWCVFLVIF